MTVTPVANCDSALRKCRESVCGGSGWGEGIDIENPCNFGHYAEKAWFVAASYEPGLVLELAGAPECVLPLMVLNHFRRQ
jgi:hypothetical protein